MCLQFTCRVAARCKAKWNRRRALKYTCSVLSCNKVLLITTKIMQRSSNSVADLWRLRKDVLSQKWLPGSLTFRYQRHGLLMVRKTWGQEGGKLLCKTFRPMIVMCYTAQELQGWVENAGFRNAAFAMWKLRGAAFCATKSKECWHVEGWAEGCINLILFQFANQNVMLMKFWFLWF